MGVPCPTRVSYVVTTPGVVLSDFHTTTGLGHSPTGRVYRVGPQLPLSPTGRVFRVEPQLPTTLLSSLPLVRQHLSLEEVPHQGVPGVVVVQGHGE